MGRLVLAYDAAEELAGHGRREWDDFDKGVVQLLCTVEQSGIYRFTGKLCFEVPVERYL